MKNMTEFKKILMPKKRKNIKELKKLKDENLTSFGIDKYGKSCLPYHKLYKDFKNLIVFPKVFYIF